jgi:hypothetical protein
VSGSNQVEGRAGWEEEGVVEKDISVTTQRFIVVELTQPGSNFRLNICVVFTTNYSFSRRRHLCRQRDTLDDQLRES